jgi:hypothetical protein
MNVLTVDQEWGVGAVEEHVAVGELLEELNELLLRRRV